MKKRKGSQFIIRISEVEKRALMRLAESRDIPAAQIIRQAIKGAVVEAGIAVEKR